MFFLLQIGIKSSIYLSILGVAFWITGSLSDLIATNSVHTLKPKFDEKKIHFPIIEANKALPPNPTLHDQLFNWTTVVTLLLIPFIFFISPIAGIVAGLIRFMIGGMCNFRARKRIILTLALINSQLF